MEQALNPADLTRRIEYLPVTRALWGRVALIALGGVVECYDLFMSGYISPGLVREKILTFDGGLIGGVSGFLALFFAGLYVGTAVFGYLADRFGRRAIFTYSLIWYAVMAVALAFQPSALGVIVFRFLSGIGIGVELVTIDTFVTEIAPRAARGRAFAFSNALEFIGMPIVAFLSWMLVPRDMFGMSGWRLVVLIGAFGSVIMWWIRTRLSESPRWLIEQGRLEEANVLISEWEDQARREGGRLTTAVPETSESLLNAEKSWRTLWRPPVRRNTIMMIFFNIFQAIGYYGFFAWAPAFLISKGITVSTSLAYTFVIAFAAPLGPLLSMLLIERFDRKWLIVAGSLGVVCSGMWFAFSDSTFSIIAAGATLAGINNIFSLAYHGYQPELFPTGIRGRAVGFVYSFSRLANIGGSFIIPWILYKYGVISVFYFIAGCMFSAGMIIALFGPRIMCRTLDTAGIKGANTAASTAPL